MITTGARLTMRVAALGAAAGLLLASCSSSPEADTSSSSGSSGSPSATGDSLAPSATGSDEATGAAAQACAAYFALDLLNSTYAGGAVADGDMTEAQVRADFHRLLKDLVAQGKVAVADGTVGQKLVTNGLRMKKAVNGLAKDQALSDLSKKQQAKFILQSSRVEKTCARAGFPLPADNTTARTAAGV